MPAINEEYISRSNGTVALWNRDTGSIREFGTFSVSGSSSALTFFDIDVASDGTLFGIANATLFQLDLETNSATSLGSVGFSANALEISPSGLFLIGFSNFSDIDVRSGFDNSYLRTIDTAGGNGGIGPTSAGDLQLVGNTLYLSGANDVLVGINLFSGLEVARITDNFVSTIYGMSTDGNDLIYYAGSFAYTYENGSFVQIEGFNSGGFIYGAADAIFPTVTFNATQGADVLLGSDFSDIIYGLGGRDNIFAGNGDDLVVAGLGADNVSGGLGYDEIYGGGGADTVGGGGGNDTLFGGGGADVVFGGAGEDTVGGAGGNDRVFGGSESDVVGGGGGNDQVFGGSGDDIIYGSRGTDQVFGSSGDDTVYGGSENDTVYGGAGDDQIFGGTGADTMIGGTGNDTAQGGFGADTFVFSNGHGRDRITDFRANDTIDFSLLSSASSFNTLLQTQTVISGAGVEFVFSNDLRLFLEGVDLNDLTASQFIF